MIANRAYLKIPIAVIDPNGDAFVHQVPADVVEILAGRWLVDL
jgi:hypothetical protein